MIQLRSKHLSNNSATTGFVWEEFDFEACENFAHSKYIWGICTMLCSVLGLPACVAILWEMFKTHRSGTPLTANRFFIFNLTAMDAIFLLYIPPGVLNHFILQSWVCEAIFNFTYALNICGRPLLMACICLDCYLAVVHPITYHQRRSMAPRVAMAAVVWTLTLASGIVFFLFYQLYFSIMSNVPFIVSIVIIGICDSCILHALLKSDPDRKRHHQQKQRAVQTLTNSLVVTVFTYLPPVFLIVLGRYLFTDQDIFLCIIGIPITVISSMGSAVMPILQLNNNGKLDFFRCGWCRKS